MAGNQDPTVQPLLLASDYSLQSLPLQIPLPMDDILLEFNQQHENRQQTNTLGIHA